ncbi:hypothetical protein Q9L58_006595 [Maublancomyces gigas]|uniref:Uncharacterized protein n=1 Tax=Discina gigas TaxID=1032678 RepID=A0ABR3GEW3_9PEZI
MHHRTASEPVSIPPRPSITRSSTYSNFPEEIQAHSGDKQAFEVIKDLLLVFIGAGALGRLQFDSNPGAPSVFDINDVVHLLCDKIEKIDSQDMENKTDKVIRLVVTAAAESKEAAVEIKKAAILSMKAAAQSATASKETAEASKHTVEASNRAAEAAARSAVASRGAAEASRYTAEAAKDSREASTQNTKETQVQGAKLTVFTVITTVFTPLNFLTSYLGMNLNDMRGTTWTQQQFWALTAPITLVILIFVLVVAFKYQWIARLFTWVSEQSSMASSEIVPTLTASSSTITPRQGLVAAEEGARDLADVEPQNTRFVRSDSWPWKLLR